MGAEMTSDSTFLGTVQDVQGATVGVRLEAKAISGLAFVEGQGYRIGQVGSFIRIPMGYIDLFGVVSQVGASASPTQESESHQSDSRWMTVQLVGQGQAGGEFKRGIAQYPTIGDSVHLLTKQDLTRIYGRPDSPNYVSVGRLASVDSIPALLDINKLLTRHSAVLGATGAGKSTTVASLLNSLTEEERYSSARILVIDIHGEYGNAIGDRASVFRVNPSSERGEKRLCVPYWAMTFEEILDITFGSLDDASRGAVLEKIVELKEHALREEPRSGVTEETLTVDSPVPFSIHKLWFDFYRRIHATHTEPQTGQSEETEALEMDDDGNPLQPGDAMSVIPPKYRTQNQAADGEKIYLSGSTLNMTRPLEALASMLRDPRFDFLFNPGRWTPNVDGIPDADLDELLELWIGGEEPVTILDLSGIPASVLDNLVGALLRVIYNSLFWAQNMSEGGRERPLLLVLEEAHSYLDSPETSSAASEVQRIVKEGRKYGIGAMVVSQRPSEIDSTIMSQCGTIFAMRLNNPTDRGQVLGTASDNLKGLLDMLPTLRTGEAIIVGESVHLPIRALIDLPEHEKRPDSGDPLVYVMDALPDEPSPEAPGGWNREREDSNYEEVVEVWRKQDPNVERDTSDGEN